MKVIETHNRRIVTDAKPNGVRKLPKKALKYVIVRTYMAGVFSGELESRKGDEVVLLNARRLWHWSGAATLSQMAMEGTSDPSGCKFPCAVSRVTLLGVIEILDTNLAARHSIEGVPVWRI